MNNFEYKASRNWVILFIFVVIFCNIDSIVSAFNTVQITKPTKVLHQKQYVEFKCIELHNKQPKYMVGKLSNNKIAVAQKIEDNWEIVCYEP